MKPDRRVSNCSLLTLRGMLRAMVAFLLVIFFVFAGEANCSTEHRYLHHRSERSLCAELIQPYGYPCSEHTTEDGYLLALQRVSSSKGGVIKLKPGPPILLQHGLFQGGDTWFVNSMEQSLGFILADHGFDVWVGNVRGTHWSHGHISLSEKDKEFWDWSWQELALYDLAAMINYVHAMANSKIFFVGHSQGTIMGLAAFTQPEIVDMVEAAALLCPISYLSHVSAQFVRKMVNMHLDQMLLAMGIHQLELRSDTGVRIMDFVCDGHIDCNNLLSSLTGKNCCFNDSRIDYYLEYEPHPSSSKNFNHLFQMIRKGTFAKYDYGWWGNMKKYGNLQPPSFDIGCIPESLPLWMGYGGNDALADVTDVEHTLKELQCKPELLYLDSYGHIDFVLSVTANEDIYKNMIGFFRSWGKPNSS
ncbi:PREDICTED: triacylglycerol lipase 1 isoform X2 [Nelumbo nucifera]|uniref:Lipase n=1 Tax=Nelumbo nucifera TaxID=4432 RepID=A0A1U8QAA8_NELNU|nr:PREDICTED: triacylglycerol lipase 1 isoform X2 [Nelumbo nucifera]